MVNPPEGPVEAGERYEDNVLSAKDQLDVAVIRTQFIFGRGLSHQSSKPERTNRSIFTSLWPRRPLSISSTSST